jgi:hypothetical protein
MLAAAGGADVGLGVAGPVVEKIGQPGADGKVMHRAVLEMGRCLAPGIAMRSWPRAVHRHIIAWVTSG